MDLLAKIRDKKQIRHALIVIVSAFACAFATAEQVDYDALLQEALSVRSSDPARSTQIIESLPRDELSPNQQDQYDFSSAYSLFINGDVAGSIAAYETLSKNATWQTHNTFWGL